MCCCGTVIRSQGNPLCLCASRVLVAGYEALDAAINTSLIIATSGEHHSAASRREDGTSRIGTLRIKLVLLLFLMGSAFDVRHVHLPYLLCLPCTMLCVRHPSTGSHIEEPGVDVLPRD